MGCKREARTVHAPLCAGWRPACWRAGRWPALSGPPAIGRLVVALVQELEPDHWFAGLQALTEAESPIAMVRPILTAMAKGLEEAARYLEEWGAWFAQPGIAEEIGVPLPDPEIAAIGVMALKSIRATQGEEPKTVDSCHHSPKALSRDHLWRHPPPTD